MDCAAENEAIGRGFGLSLLLSAHDDRKSPCHVIAKPVRGLVVAIRIPCPGPLRAAGPTDLALPLGELSAQPTERACMGMAYLSARR